MTTEKRIEIAAMFLARCINEPLDIRASGDTRDKLCRYALAWADALAEIAEQYKPKTRYDWSKAPEWANWAATDENGNIYMYRRRPKITEFGDWMHDGSEYDLIYESSGGENCADWAASLECRPE